MVAIDAMSDAEISHLRVRFNIMSSAMIYLVTSDCFRDSSEIKIVTNIISFNENGATQLYGTHTWDAFAALSRCVDQDFPIRTDQITSHDEIGLILDV